MYEHKREKWIDVVRGFLIILVVLGHSISGPYYDLNSGIDYIYLFHMPAFFILSGYLYKDRDESIFKLLFKRAKRLLIPYISYLILINIPIIINNYIDTKDIANLYRNIIFTLLGGQFLNQYSGVLWFLTCLFFTEAFFIISNRLFKNDYLRIISVVFLYTLAHIEAWFFSGGKLPLALDISLITITYFAIGFYFKKLLINRKVAIISFIISIVTLFLIKIGYINFGLELWGHHYTNYILDLIIPASISLMIFNLCSYLEKSKILEELGKNTITIMCLHISLNRLIMSIFGNYGSTLFTLIGVFIPFILSKFIFRKNRILNSLFIG